MLRSEHTKWVLAVALAVGGCSGADANSDTVPAKSVSKKPGKTTGQRVVRVEVAVLMPGSPRLQLKLPGEVEGSRDAMLASANGGYVEKLLGQQGQQVRKGQPIAWVDRAVYQVGLDQAQAQVDLAKSELELTQKAGQSLPKARLDAAEIQVRAAEAAYALARIRARRAVITAPFAGILAEVDIEEGEVLPPGGPVARLVSVDPILVSASVSDRDIVTLKTGLPVKVTTDADSTIFDGTILRISPAANLETRTFEVEVEIKNPAGRLLPGMVASVALSVAVATDALSIPQYVLVTRTEGNGVFVVEGDTVKWRTLQLGRVVRDQVLVLGGIKAGDRVVVAGHRELADGDKVLVSREGSCCVQGRVGFGQAN